MKKHCSINIQPNIDAAKMAELRQYHDMKVDFYMVKQKVFVRKKSKRERILDQLNEKIHDLDSIKQRLRQLE